MTASAAAPAGRIAPDVRLALVSTEATSTAPRPGKLLLSRREAAAALGISLSHFQSHVQPSLRCVYSGHLRLYRPLDLERWIEREVANGGEPDGR